MKKVANKYIDGKHNITPFSTGYVGMGKLTRKPKVTKESVDNLRLRVYEAETITEEDKNLFLEYLDLENYE